MSGDSSSPRCVDGARRRGQLAASTSIVHDNVAAFQLPGSDGTEPSRRSETARAGYDQRGRLGAHDLARRERQRDQAKRATYFAAGFGGIEQSDWPACAGPRLPKVVEAGLLGAKRGSRRRARDACGGCRADLSRRPSALPADRALRLRVRATMPAQLELPGKRGSLIETFAWATEQLSPTGSGGRSDHSGPLFCVIDGDACGRRGLWPQLALSRNRLPGLGPDTGSGPTTARRARRGV